MILFKRDQKRTGIFKDKVIRIPFNDDAANTQKVGMDECIDEGLAKRLMGGCLVSAFSAFKSERGW